VVRNLLAKQFKDKPKAQEKLKLATEDTGKPKLHENSLKRVTTQSVASLRPRSRIFTPTVLSCTP
jgi:hypothetical protein